MADAAFEDPRLAALYDVLDDDRSDLDLYADLAAEFGVTSVLDVGCGTGVFACLLAERGLQVVGLDPAAASLDVARRKPHADKVWWVHGDAASLPPLQVGLATMTGNVAQVFLTDDDWADTLRAVHRALRPGGRLVFETRRPERRAWEEWAGEAPEIRDVPGVGEVERRLAVTRVSLPYVSFRYSYRFLADRSEVVSDSTLRFRYSDELQASLEANGYTVRDVRDAPDRPGREYVVLADRVD